MNSKQPTTIKEVMRKLVISIQINAKIAQLKEIESSIKTIREIEDLEPHLKLCEEWCATYTTIKKEIETLKKSM